jgi:release factor glutamine methyltransferase
VATSSAEPDPAIVAELRAAGCVFADEEAALLQTEATDQADLRQMLARRVAGEPLEQIVGWAEFCGLRIVVTPGVFVPRKRTEELVELAVALLVDIERPVVVDLCCGTGAIGVAIAAREPGTELHAADLDPDAVACARRNVSMGEVHEGDLYDALPAGLAGRVDVLAVNAPYVPTDEIAMMPTDARDHEHRIALDGGPDGLDLHRRVAAGASAWLRPDGTLLIETGRRQAEGTAAACADAGLVAAVVVREVSTLVRAISAGSGSSGTMAR